MIGSLGEMELTDVRFNHLVIDPPRDYYLSHVEGSNWNFREIIEEQQRILVKR